MLIKDRYTKEEAKILKKRYKNFSPIPNFVFNNTQEKQNFLIDILSIKDSKVNIILKKVSKSLNTDSDKLHITLDDVLYASNKLKEMAVRQESVIRRYATNYHDFFVKGRGLNSELYKNWRITIFRRDNWTCVECGSVGRRLNAHHVKSWKDYPRLRFEIENGVTLCESCHKDFHKKYGYRTTEEISETSIRKYQKRWQKD